LGHRPSLVLQEAAYKANREPGQPERGPGERRCDSGKRLELKALDRPASVDAPLDSLRVAIAQVENSADVTFGYEGQTMVFRAKKAGDTSAAASVPAGKAKKK